MMKSFSDVELAELADWAESNERSSLEPDAKKAYGAIRQGADWLIRFHIKKRQQDLEKAGDSELRKSVPRELTTKQ
jgi:hypothetical protein